tara:strand:- start:76 stop:342 length:267 start_codon:yes stop_codon:yes gene_type:complete
MDIRQSYNGYTYLGDIMVSIFKNARQFKKFADLVRKEILGDKRATKVIDRFIEKLPKTYNGKTYTRAGLLRTGVSEGQIRRANAKIRE